MTKQHYLLKIFREINFKKNFVKLISRKNLIKKNTHPTVTSKIFDPTEEDTAMSPLPC